MLKETEKQKSFNLPVELSLFENKEIEIKVQQKVISKELEHLKNLQKQKVDILKPIQNKIKSGEFSTNDKIKDFAIVYFDNSEEKENQIRNLESQLKEHKGEFVLLKTIESEAHGWIDFGSNSGGPHPELYHWEEKAHIGVINEKMPLDLNIKIGKIIIAPEHHCLIHKYKDSTSLQNEPVSFPLWGFDIIGKSLESIYSNQLNITGSIYPTVEQIKSRGVKDIAMEIIVGDEKVYSYLNYNESVFVEIAKKLGREALKK